MFSCSSIELLLETLVLVKQEARKAHLICLLVHLIKVLTAAGGNKGGDDSMI